MFLKNKQKESNARDYPFWRTGGSQRLKSGILAVVILITIFFLMQYYNVFVVTAREIALKTELTHLRLQLQVFKLQTGKYPDDLRELSSQKQISFIRPEERPYSDPQRPVNTDNEKFPVDPFGNKYKYLTGKVTSATGGYENW